MTRIVAGTHGSRRIATPPGRTTRPTSERTREAMFASLAATHDLETGPFLDVYAGSGAVGIEALSRGAPRAVFVESDRNAAQVIRDNLAALQLGDRSSVLILPAAGAAPRLNDLAAHTVFADPPYDIAAEDLRDVLLGLHDVGAIAPDAVVVVERAGQRRDPWAWPTTAVVPVRDRRYGGTHLWYGRAL